jgi:hypothetical protein
MGVISTPKLARRRKVFQTLQAAFLVRTRRRQCGSEAAHTWMIFSLGKSKLLARNPVLHPMIPLLKARGIAQFDSRFSYGTSHSSEFTSGTQIAMNSLFAMVRVSQSLAIFFLREK